MQKYSKCPKCKESLLWEVFQGMRLFRSRDGVSFYNAKCPNHGHMEVPVG